MKKKKQKISIPKIKRKFITNKTTLFFLYPYLYKTAVYQPH